MIYTPILFFLTACVLLMLLIWQQQLARRIEELEIWRKNEHDRRAIERARAWQRPPTER